ncbi:tumor necrosis factor receptor superfamily member 10B-like isoform X2 [Rana temporaria]|uniref:tumor necrosis factor receptor superfamily member 10B-like isoform X2 n=1 Tax=Rana temporaria TaxID=8407 RepID=UPI001AADC444|nr:tumor necrosis factor receptor superfamily member 10B-like isoform X2 [Rana temporaria]
MVLWSLSFLGLSAVMTAGMDQNKLPAEHPANNRTARSLPCPPNEYSHNGRCCMHCPAGTYVSSHCTVQHGPGSCSPCTPGKDFAAGPHGLERCLACHPCRFDDQVQVADCTATEDYRCQCKPNTFCTDTCHLYCKDCTRCPEGQYEKHECTPTSDTVCEDIGSLQPTAKGDLDDSLSVALPVSIGPAGITIACVVALLLYRSKKKKERQKLAENGNEEYQRPASEDSLKTVSIVPGTAQPAQERVDNLGAEEVYTPLGQQENENFIQVGKSNQRDVTGRGCEEEAPLTTDPTDKQQPSLGACSCVSDRIKFKNDKTLTDEEWLECYNCLKEHVTPNRWKEMMRHLGLREGDIQSILLDYTHFREASYQMFLLWRNQNGQSASMSKVFHVLNKMDLRGCKENVANDLIFNGILVA